MYLTDYEQAMLEGKEGEGVAEAMRIQVALGEAFDAERMVEISRSHEAFGGSGPSVWFLELFSKPGAQARVPITCNPAEDPDYLQSKGIKITPDFAASLRRLHENRRIIGVIPTNNCTPYLQNNVPHFGEVIGFAESSATPYVNAVCGARTNREASESALASSITGRVPLYGLLLDENRKGDFLIKVEATLKDDFDYHILGYLVGEKVGAANPVFTGMSSLRTSPEEFTALSAELATGGAVGMYHVVGVTPEAPNLETAFGKKSPKKEITITDADLQKTQQSLSFEEGKLGWVMFGCPHYSIHQVKEVARHLEGKTIHKDVELWVLTSAATEEFARRLGYLDIIRKAGGDIVSGSCPDSPYWTQRFSGKVGMTDSPKGWYYPQHDGNHYMLKRRSECLDAALKGGC
ncbi:hypothetical protein ES703_115040 [subsurface metagenome]